MKQVQAILLSLGALVSAVPGYTSIQTGIGTPPDHGPVFGGTQIAISSLMLLGILLYRSDIMRMNRNRLSRISGWCAATFLAFLLLYSTFLNLCTVRVVNEAPPHNAQVFYFPIWPGGELAKAIDQTSRQEVASRYRRALQEILDEQGIRLAATTGILLLFYVATFASLVAAFMFLSIRMGAQVEDDPVVTGDTRAGG